MTGKSPIEISMIPTDLKIQIAQVVMVNQDHPIEMDHLENRQDVINAMVLELTPHQVLVVE